MREVAVYSQGRSASDMRHSFIPSFSTCWMGTCLVPDTILASAHQLWPKQVTNLTLARLNSSAVILETGVTEVLRGHLKELTFIVQ